MPGQGIIEFSNSPNITVVNADSATVANVIIQRDRMGAMNSRILIEVNFGKSLGTIDPVSGNEQFQVMTMQSVFNESFGDYAAKLQALIGTEFTAEEVASHIQNLLTTDATIRTVAEEVINFGRRANCVQWPHYVATTVEN